MNLKNLSYLSFLQFIATGKRGKHARTPGNSGYFQDGGTLISKLPAFKTLVAFIVLMLFKLPDPRASIF